MLDEMYVLQNSEKFFLSVLLTRLGHLGTFKQLLPYKDGMK